MQTALKVFVRLCALAADMLAAIDVVLIVGESVWDDTGPVSSPELVRRRHSNERNFARQSQQLQDNV